MSAEIKSVTLQIGKKEIVLSVEEAKNLKEALEGFFGKEVIKVVEHHGYPWHWSYPMYTSTPLTHPGPSYIEVTCSDGSIAKASYQAETQNLCLSVNT